MSRRRAPSSHEGVDDDRATSELTPLDELPSLAARRTIAGFVVVLLLCASAGFEVWPFTGFRLFSTARERERVVWEARTVDAAERETVFDAAELPIGYRYVEWPLAAVAEGSDADRRDVCIGVAEGARRLGRTVARVAIYRVDEQLEREGGDWTVSRSPTLAYVCHDVG